MPGKEDNSEFTIVTSLKKTPNLYLVALLFSWCKIVFYKIVGNKKKYCKQKNMFAYIKQSKGKKIIGHPSLLMSLFRGFDALGIKYNYNPGLKNIKGNVILCWTNPKDFYKLVELKDKGQVNKIVCVPTSPARYYDFIPTMVKDNRIDCYLAASEWMKKSIEKDLSDEYKTKIIIWPSGVQWFPKQEKKIFNACLYYCKKGTPKPEILDMLNKLHINVYVLQYDYYYMEQYSEILKKIDFAIFQMSAETQGLAYAEAWMQNVPTLINEYEPLTDEFYKDKYSSAPYLMNNGAFYKDFTHLSSLLYEYKENPQKFLQKFSPYEYVSQYMTDVYSVNELMKIFRN